MNGKIELNICVPGNWNGTVEFVEVSRFVWIEGAFSFWILTRLTRFKSALKNWRGFPVADILIFDKFSQKTTV